MSSFEDALKKTILGIGEQYTVAIKDLVEDLGGHLKSGHVWSLENRP